MRLSKWQTWGLFFSIAIISMLVAWWAMPLISSYTLHPGNTLAIPPLNAISLINITSTILFFGLIFGALIWVSLTLAQKTDIHILMWNAPLEKNIFNACLIPGATIGGFFSIVWYIALRMLAGNNYLHSNIAPNIHLLLWLALIIMAGIFSAFSILLVASIILWLISRIQGISHSTAINITTFLTIGLVNVIPIVNYINDSQGGMPLFMSLSLTQVVFSTLIKYSFEAAILTNIVISLILTSLSILL